VRKIREADVPPGDLDAEGVVLAASILGGRDVIEQLRTELKPSHFYSEANRHIYAALLELANGSEPIDNVALARLLRRRELLTTVGGTPYIAQLTDATPATANALAHARAIRDAWRRREAARVCQRVAVEVTGDVGDLGGYLADIARDLDALLEPADQKPAPVPAPTTPAGIITAWEVEGSLVRIPTGIQALDKLCRGGLPIPWRVIVIGPPSAGKTLVEVATANHIARATAEAGACVGILAVDEEPEDITVRLLQIAGYSVAEAEQRDPEMLRQMTAALEGLAIRLYDITWTVESASADLAAWAKEQGRHGVLFIDSLQTARSADGMGKPPREAVEANVRAMRIAATTHRLLVVATSEANRASYRNDSAAQDSNDMAAGAETRAIEFGAQTLLMLRTPKDESDIISVRVVKNRRAYVGEFFLRLDRERHRITECDDPNVDPHRVATREQEQRQSVKASVLFDAEHLANVLRLHPEGLNERALRAELRAQGHKWGVTRLGAARSALLAGHKGCRLVELSEGQGKPKLSKLVVDDLTEERAAE